MPTLFVLFEGGGENNRTRELLLPGMSALLSPIGDFARAKRWKWRLVACGGRQEAYKRFMLARRQADPEDIVILLVDSEGDIRPVRNERGVQVTEKIPHLKTRRGDQWALDGVSEDHVHVMAQTMEAWIVSDPAALVVYYGKDFLPNALPRRQNLEEEPKQSCADALEAATRRTKKGAYHKIQHAKDLLGRIDRELVKERCPHAKVMFDLLPRLIEAS